MTGNIFFDVVIIFLIAYAIINILYEFADCFIHRYASYHPKDCLILPLSHGTKSLECDVRMALKRSCDLKCALIIVEEDLDSDEQMILWRLTDDSENVILSHPDEVTQKIKTAMAINASFS